MLEQEHFSVIRLPDLKWPESLRLRKKRFRLFIAADSRGSSTDAVSQFVSGALQQGMVYCCLWGPGCERFHDIVDDVVAEDGRNECRFVGPGPGDAIMTTWHSDESLEQALEFFATSALPTEGFRRDSDYWLIACVINAEWARTAARVLQSGPAPA
jgi:hypothetical protein